MIPERRDTAIIGLTKPPYEAEFDLSAPTYAQRIKRKVGTAVLGPIVTRLAAENRAQLAGKLIRSQLVTLKRPEVTEAQAITALILPKPGFSEDIQASLVRDGRFCIVSLDRAYTKFVYRAFMPKTVDDNNYRSAPPETADKKLQLREFWQAAWPHVSRGQIDILLTGNFSYHAEQELTAALEVHGTPVVALHKECLKSPALEAFYQHVYCERKVPFRGRYISTYNEIERDIQIRAGIISPDKVTVCGMARLDKIHRWRKKFGGATRQTEGRPTVLFMSFNTRTGAPLISRKLPGRREILDDVQEAVGWHKLVAECHTAMVDLALQAPDIDVVIKAKDHARALAVIEESFGHDFRSPPNLKIICGGDPFSLITRADVFCGFNSTSLFEALAANVPIVSPCFVEAAADETRGYVIDLGDAAEQAHSRQELIDLLAARARAQHAAGHATTLADAQLWALDHWLGNPDGNAGERIASLVSEIVRSEQRAAA